MPRSFKDACRLFSLLFAAPLLVHGSAPTTAHAATVTLTTGFPAKADDLPANSVEYERFVASGFSVHDAKFAAHIQPVLSPPFMNADDRPFTQDAENRERTLDFPTPSAARADLGNLQDDQTGKILDSTVSAKLPEPNSLALVGVGTALLIGLKRWKLFGYRSTNHHIQHRL